MTLPQNDSFTSDIDFTTDTSEHDTNSDDQPYIYTENSSVNKMYRRISKHKIINNKYNSSSESVKKYIDNMTFESINNNINTNFYDMNTLNNMDFISIYNILMISTYIIFVDNYKLIRSTNKCFRSRMNLIDMEFPGCTFFAFEAVTIIRKNLNKLNNSVFNAELNGATVYVNKETICYSIMFNDGEILKNCLYKKMEIQQA